MIIWQRITTATVALCAGASVLSMAFGAIYFFSPFPLAIGDFVVQPPPSMSMESLGIGIVAAGVGILVAGAILYLQQALMGLMAMLEMRKLSFCADEIDRCFGSEARDKYMAMRLDEITDEAGSRFGRFNINF